MLDLFEEVDIDLSDITQHEILALRTRYNLADAHTHQRQSPTQRQIVQRLPQLWFEAEETTQYALEQKFIKKFFRLHRQDTALTLNRTMLFYAASIAMVTIGTFLAQRRLSVSLIDPCFDNLHDILKHNQVPLLPLKEELFHDADAIYRNLQATVTGDVIALVDPNNPTGFTLLKHGRRGFQELIRYCRDHDKILMVDFCFAAFALMDPDFGRFDVYQMLEESGVSYIAIEDTGKTWPVQDAKCALLTVSLDLHAQIYNIHTSILLNVSSFILNLLSAYLDDSAADGFTSVRGVLEENREFARRTLAGSVLDYIEPAVKVSVAWFRIKDPRLSASRLREIAFSRNVYVLPGTYFFWSRKELGERHIRIALARDPRQFRDSILQLREALDGIRRG
jgi:aspartate/methionine/tyrosine aminotransferase